MKAIIFAGGEGKRLWPLSRTNSPKQFEQIIGNKSTIQMAVDRLTPEFHPKDIYISTVKKYKQVLITQLPQIPQQNFILEPEKKDVGPAVGLVIGILYKKFKDEPVVILWCDHLVKKPDIFKKIILTAGDLVSKDKNKLIFIGQKPRFASQNLGWIEFGDKIKTINGIDFFSLKSFKYRPDAAEANLFFKNKQYSWNLGYFVSTISFIYEQFMRFSPQIMVKVNKIANADMADFDNVLNQEYQQMPEISFDNAILEQLDPKNIYVVNEDIGWSDIGAWDSLKDALQKHQLENITQGSVLLSESRDNLVYNYDAKKTIVGLDLSEMVVINTKDVLLITKKSSSSKLKKLVNNLSKGDNQHLV
ncbi:hypothetical protein A3C23_05940 [Candidatus Roizmanbacteria bacterium RIFCSPHIGHO2_02_FULL_37_13b]|uniref:Nucleotidyl transferase domain-containing protein n=1 Tax=Candidatus Roizmanbacteria bacterium RIFCSPLOWO2_02_FULL_36_11 TaxID=1802071 RepID=A0A1F7JCP9_9BACT|nr:MAG: hypothetical protein A3C23_05940 [Candidatus Roizmanbacteria bacterium RIFCSPHIGHO2_02_FULL_37_13b]OGK53393.1 MAG: hypothetical protein A3H78_02510 [Candidatus Roizmanbacteria bacterium RIFCSPLOWO2_02_FULL_36_11]